MRISVISDIHGNVADLARVADRAQHLVILGDVLDYVDYYDPAGGVLGTLFGGDRVARLISLRTAGDFDAYHAYDRELWSGVPDPQARLDEVVAEQYERVVAALAGHPDVLLILGNVDVEHVWAAVAPEHLRARDGEVVDVDGVRLAFIGGGAVPHLPTGSPWQSFDRSYEEFLAVVERLSGFDVLCSHVPPNLPGLRHDTVSGRDEMYGPGLAELIRDQRPPLALSGHVHHPRATEVLLAPTRCINVGYFKRQPEPFEFDTDELRQG